MQLLEYEKQLRTAGVWSLKIYKNTVLKRDLSSRRSNYPLNLILLKDLNLVNTVAKSLIIGYLINSRMKLTREFI